MEKRNRNIRLSCDVCGRTWEVPTWYVVDAQKDPEAVQMICDGIFFVDCCPCCGKQQEFIAQTIFYDPQKSAMIFLVEDIAEFATIQSTIQEIGNQRNVDFSKGYVRFTTTSNEFREKVMLLYDGLDDRVVELIKLCALEAVRKEGFAQIFEETRCAINPKSGKMCIDFIGDRPRNIEIERDFYDRFAAKMIEALNKEKTPFEVNFDWAVRFAETHDC